MRRFIAFILSCLFLVCFSSAPVYADVAGLDLGGDIVELADWVISSLYKGTTQASNWIEHLYDESTCPQTFDPNGLHNFVERHTEVNGKPGLYYVCEYCGKSAGEVLEEAESEYVASLPAQTVTSDGGIIWRPEFGDLTSDISLRTSQGVFYLNDGNDFTVRHSDGYYTVSTQRNSNNAIIYNYSDTRGDLNWLIGFENVYFTAPFDGVYSIVPDVFCVGNFVKNDESVCKIQFDFSSYTHFFNAGDRISYSQVVYSDNSSVPDGFNKVNSYNVTISLPYYKVLALTAYDVTTSDTSATYNTGTRATSITGNYGIVNGSGEVRQIGTQQIVNETNNTYYSPTTGQPETFNDWTYDYSDRSYHLTTDSGDTVTVTYGDEHVTINEGDTVTNVYYITNNTANNSGEGGNGGGQDTPSTPTHTHSYTSEVTTEPTCTRSGIRTYTCSCGASYTESIPAVGHAWEVVNNQLAEYSSSDGTLLQAGFIVYQCSVCGQQYRADDESLPPGVIGQNLQLQEVSDQALAVLPQLQPMYEGYLGFLSEVFPYLPSEIMQLFYFGVASSVLIAIFKALRG